MEEKTTPLELVCAGIVYSRCCCSLNFAPCKTGRNICEIRAALRAGSLSGSDTMSAFNVSPYCSIQASLLSIFRSRFMQAKWQGTDEDRMAVIQILVEAGANTDQCLSLACKRGNQYSAVCT